MNTPGRTFVAALMLLLVVVLCVGAASAGYWYGNHEGYIVGQSDSSASSYKQGYGEGQQKGYMDGLTEGQRLASQLALPGVKKGSASTFNTHNPTYQEVKDFLAEDRTNSKHYVKDQYVCSDYASEVNNNAESRGIRCAVVELRWPNDYAHALVAFDTVDKGLLYFEPQSDAQVTVEVGQSYSRVNHQEPPSQDDTILRVLVMW